MTHQEIIDQTIEFVRKELSKAEGGHDWWHTYRVWQNSKLIAQSVENNSDPLVIELGALLHDIADSKFHGGDENVGPEKAQIFLQSLHLPQEIIGHVVNIVRYVSFKNDLESRSFNSPELEIVQDADRLDAIGAVGIARAFSFGGHKGNPLYDPDISPVTSMDKETYKKRNGPTINHFYEKLLLLRERMNTPQGRAIAEERHQFMQIFLDQFFAEMNGEK